MDWMGGWMDGWTDGWTDGLMDGWMDGWTDEWTDGRMDGWMDGWGGMDALMAMRALSRNAIPFNPVLVHPAAKAHQPIDRAP